MHAKNNAKVKAKIAPIIKNEVVISDRSVHTHRTKSTPPTKQVTTEYDQSPRVAPPSTPADISTDEYDHKHTLTISDPKTIAQMLREQYDSVYSKPDENCLIYDPVTLFSTTNSESPSPTNIDFQDLVTPIKQISNNSAAGPDNFSRILL